jgi:methionine sulfoxide reductase catalytic subunit
VKLYPPAIAGSEITDEAVFLNRRQLLRQAAGVGIGLALTPSLFASAQDRCRPLALSDLGAELTDEKAATGYNNYYEFSTDKQAVKFLARELSLKPWQLRISGQVEKPLTLDVDAIRTLCEQERIYRFRCVEGWSMVVPWLGIPLAELIALAKPLSSAKYVKFTALHRPSEMIGQRHPTLEWPYVEALRMDEAMHPLTLLATGLYGKALPPQNGAPLRLVVPWKYGFKSIKAVQSIELLEQPVMTTWQTMAPGEYGFYANVNPEVAHPRWSQSREAPLGQARKRPTLMFNGYAEQVAALYQGMDLQKHF